MEIDTDELTEYLKNVCNGIIKAESNEMSLQSKIDFELSVITDKVGEGKLKIFIANIGGKYEKESVSKIKFSMGKKDRVSGRIMHD
jgi:translation initiation factor 2B subunit (eIF-2B alpha/beta/delta family)